MKPTLDPSVSWAREGFQLSTGRFVYANDLIIGINPDLNLFDGYDGHLHHDDLDDPWTPAECVELADYMIGLWTQFKARQT